MYRVNLNADTYPSNVYIQDSTWFPSRKFDRSSRLKLEVVEEVNEEDNHLRVQYKL